MNEPRPKDSRRHDRVSKPQQPTVSMSLAFILAIVPTVIGIGTTYGVMRTDIAHIQATVKDAEGRTTSQIERLDRTVRSLQDGTVRNTAQIEAQGQRLTRIERDVGAIRDVVERRPRR